MQINKINSQNFNGLYINKDALLPLMMQSSYYLHTQNDINILFSKIDKCNKTQYTDVFVTKNGDVYVKDRKAKTRIRTATNKSLYHRYYLALTKALVIDDCYKNGENPYQYIN